MSVLIEVSARDWEKEYKDGKWDFLNYDSAEKARCSIVGTYCNHYYPEGKILDVGCGSGILNEFLNERQRQQYLGFDLSQTAIDVARRKGFNAILADANFFQTEEKFDVIVFNEVIYHLDYQIILKQYSKLLANGGLMIISMFRIRSPFIKIRQYKIWKWCHLFFCVTELTHLKIKRNRKILHWDIWVMRSIQK